MGGFLVVLVIGFDLDLTLIDSRPQILASFAALAQETGTEIDLAVIDRRLGAKLEDELAHWYPSSRLVAAAAIYRRCYQELAGATVALPGGGEALAVVRRAGGSSATCRRRSAPVQSASAWRRGPSARKSWRLPAPPRPSQPWKTSLLASAST